MIFTNRKHNLYLLGPCLIWIVLSLYATLGLFTFSYAELHPGQTLPSLTTLKNVTYNDVKLRQILPDSIRLMHETGFANIPVEDLPLDLREKGKFLSGSDLAAYRQKVAVQESLALRQSTMIEQAQAEQARAKGAQQSEQKQSAPPQFTPPEHLKQNSELSPKNPNSVKNYLSRLAAEEQKRNELAQLEQQVRSEKLEDKPSNTVKTEPPRIVTEEQVKRSWINSLSLPSSLDKNYHKVKTSNEEFKRKVTNGLLDSAAWFEATEWNMKEYNRVGQHDMALLLANQLRENLSRRAQGRAAMGRDAEKLMQEQKIQSLEREVNSLKRGW